ncbi:MAG: S8 family serine peptidase [Solirubrobacterales bacterium]
MFSSGIARHKAVVLLVAAAIISLFVLLFASARGGSASVASKTGARSISAAAKTGSGALQMADATYGGSLSHETVVPDQLVVRYKSSATADERAAARRSIDASVEKKLELPRSELLSLPSNSSEKDLAAKISQQPGVEFGEPNGVVHATLTPNDTQFTDLWAMNNTGQTGGTADADIDAVEAWNTTTGSTGVVTAVIDTGVDYLHEDLDQNIWQNSGETGLDGSSHDKRTNGIDDDGNGFVDDYRGWNFAGGAGGPNDPMDDYFHGTHVAGTIAAEGNNSQGVAGVTWNTKVMPVKVLDASGSGSNTAVADGMLYAAQNGAKIANLSLGGGGKSQYMEDVVSSHPGTLYVVAAGNSANDNDNAAQFYPCNYPEDNVVCVAATDQDDKLASFSDYGPNNVDLAAPGVGIVSTKASVYTSEPGKYISLNGTSMATPHVAGSAALLLSAYPSASTQNLRDALLDSVDKLASVTNKVSSDGRLNVNNALTTLNAALTRNPATTTIDVSGSRDLRYTSGTGLANNVTISDTSTEIDLVDPSANIIPGNGCYVINSTHARCLKTSVKRIVVSTLDGNDTIATTSATPTKIDPGAGTDTVTGGPASDEVLSSTGADAMTGGGGTDTINYAATTSGVTITLDGTANDGATSEGDNVGADFETILGGSGNDTLTGGSNAVTINGSAGNDTLTGGGGNDTIFDGAGADTVNGGNGNDTFAPTPSDSGSDSWNGGGGIDTANFGMSVANTSVNVSLDDVANDTLNGVADNYHSDIENMIGGDGGDVLTGSSAANVISGGFNYDTIDGGGGADDLSGGDGLYDVVDYSSRTANLNVSLDDTANDGAASENDNVHTDIEVIRGGSGNDTLTGDDGSHQKPYIDILGHHWEGDDWLDGGPGADTISGLGGTDTADYHTRLNPVNVSIDGTANDGETGENDNVATDVEGVWGGNGSDTLTGSNSANILDGGYSGNDILNGQGGDDTLGSTSPGGNDTFTGGSGTDTVTYWGNEAMQYQYYFTTPVSITLDGVANDGFTGSSDSYASDIERFQGGAGNDTLTGDSGANYLDGAGGNNTVSGAGGNDTVIAGGAVSTADGGDGDDHVMTASYTRNYAYWNGYDISGTVFLGGGKGTLLGGNGNDELEGSTGDDTMDGGANNDTMDGSYGADVATGGSGIDSVTYRSRSEFMSITLNGIADDGWICTCGGSGEKDQVQSDVENLAGGVGNDTIIGNASANRLDGSDGDDTITGSDGADELIGGEGHDTMSGGNDNDLLRAVDDTSDNVTCGSGTDITRGDTVDTLNPDCEPSGASNATVSYEPSSSIRRATLLFDSVTGVADDVAVSQSGSAVLFHGSGQNLTAGSGCVQTNATDVTCTITAVGDDTEVRAHLLDGNDTFTLASSVTEPARVFGGAGNDVITGGAADDVIDPGLGADQISGGSGLRDVVSYLNRTNPVVVSLNSVADDGELGEGDSVAADIEDITGGKGNDTLTGNSGSNHIFGMDGNDLLDGGTGTDWLLGGGLIGDTSFDTVTYASRTNPVNLAPAWSEPTTFVDPAITAKTLSGETGENDWIGSDVEKMIGGSGNDTLHCDPTITNTSNTLDGGPGADTFNDCTLPENTNTAYPLTSDTVTYASRSAAVNASLDGAANDGVASEGDNIGAGVELVTGGSGNDVFSGDGNANKFDGADGDDTFNMVDTSADNATCGIGNDTVNGDSLDTASDDCETVNIPNGNGAPNGVTVLGSIIVFQTTGNAVNNVQITAAGGYTTVTDSAVILTANAGCSQLSANSAICPTPVGASLLVNSAAGDDTIDNATSIPMTANAGSGNDTVTGGTGNDIVDGGIGTDVMHGGAGTDTVTYATRTANVTVNPDDLAYDGESGELDQVGSDFENVITGSGNDLLYGNAANNSLSSGAGSDTMLGFGGSDTFSGGADEDYVTYGYETADVTASLDGVANDGIAGENDSIGSDVEDIQGGGGNDTLTGSNGANQLDGSPGNDTLNGLGGNDYLLGSTGNDTAVPGDGNDYFQGYDGDDTMSASLGADTFDAGNGSYDSYSYAGVAGAVTVTIDDSANDGTGGENDNIKSNVEMVTGGDGNDTLTGSSGNETLNGGPGDDALDGGLGADTLIGGSGSNDSVTYASRTGNLFVNFNFYQGSGESGEQDTIYNDVESLTGGSGNDILWAGFGGGDPNRTIHGGPGNDQIQGSDGNDTLYGDAGGDIIHGYDGNDTIDGGIDQDWLYGDNGTDTVSYSTRTANVTLQLDGTSYSGEAGEADTVDTTIENAVTGSGNDFVLGNASGNTISSGAGSDTLMGYGGNDVFNGGADEDWVSYANESAPVTASIDGVANDGPSGQSDQIQSDIEDIQGGSGDDNLFGSAVANQLDGSNGNDNLTGNDGNDSLLGSYGNDTAYPGNGNDTFQGFDGDDQMVSSPGADVFVGGNGTYDAANYGSETANLNISLDDVANDGAVGEGDNISGDTETVISGSGNDTVTGNSLANTLLGGNGTDTIDGGLGADSLQGGGGTDTVTYASRTNPLFVSINLSNGSGETGEQDSIAQDVEGVIGGSGNDVIYGGFGSDPSRNLDGGPGADQIHGGSNADTLSGGTGDDMLWGAAGNDTLNGNDGNDTLEGEAGADVFNGGNNTDTANYASRTAAETVTLDGTQNDGDTTNDTATKDNVKTDVENVTGGSGNDTITGQSSGSVANTFVGNGGNDTFTGNDGNDTLDGGTGADVFNGGTGTDTATYASRTVAETITLDGTQNDGDTTNDTATKDNVKADVENVIGGSGNDTITGPSSGSVANTLSGGDGNDTLNGGDGTDTLNGDNNNDTLDGGTGADVFNGGAGTDTATYASRTVAETVTLDGTQNDGDTTNDTATKDNVKTDVENVTGGTGADTFTGQTSGGVANTFLGGSGNDTLTGNDGNDTFDGGTGADVFNGNAGTDTVTYASRSTAETVTLDGTQNDGDTTNDTSTKDNVKTDIENVTGGTGADSITGQTSGSVANVFDGGGGNDTLTGNDGDDSLTGGTGVDTVNGGTGNDTIFLRDLTNDANTVCGLGTDVFNADVVGIGDTNTAADCETVSRT